MLIVLNSNKINHSASFDQNDADVLTEFRQKFIEKYGEETYTKAGKIIIVEENFFNVIKDRYGPPIIGEHNDMLADVITQHLAV